MSQMQSIWTPKYYLSVFCFDCFVYVFIFWNLCASFCNCNNDSHKTWIPRLFKNCIYFFFSPININTTSEASFTVRKVLHCLHQLVSFPHFTLLQVRDGHTPGDSCDLRETLSPLNSNVQVRIGLRFLLWTGVSIVTLIGPWLLKKLWSSVYPDTFPSEPVLASSAVRAPVAPLLDLLLSKSTTVSCSDMNLLLVPPLDQLSFDKYWPLANQELSNRAAVLMMLWSSLQAFTIWLVANSLISLHIYPFSNTGTVMIDC